VFGGCNHAQKPIYIQRTLKGRTNYSELGEGVSSLNGESLRGSGGGV